MRIGLDPASLRRFPPWAQRVMRILRDQFVPREFAALLSADQAIFAEGVAVAWAAKARDIHPPPSDRNGQYARRLAERLEMDSTSRTVAEQIETGTFTASPDFQAQVMKRLFAADVAERRAFAEGLAIGNRLPELLDRQAQQGATDATRIYLLLWLYWPEVAKLGSIGEVAEVLQPFFAENKNLAGAHWEERIRKLANRLGLSFRAQQTTGPAAKRLNANKKRLQEPAPRAGNRQRAAGRRAAP